MSETLPSGVTVKRTAVRFTVTADGNVADINTLPKTLVQSP